jgi:hypothetical protein
MSVSEYKILLKKHILSTTILFVLIAAFNYIVDDFNLFGSHNNDSMVYDLYNGYYITSENIAANRVDNIYDKLLYLKRNERIDVLAIGSSRTKSLHKDLIFADQSINYLNLTDGTAGLNHYAKVMGLFNKYSIPIPPKIIMGLDPWVFDEKNHSR